MTAGRKPKPTTLKLITGNPGHRPVNRSEPKPQPAIPQCPEFVQGEARKTWHKISRKLHRIGLLTEIDVMVLAVLCQSWAEYLEAAAKLGETGMLVKSPNGYPIMNPYLVIANHAVKKVRSLLAEFGMSGLLLGSSYLLFVQEVLNLHRCYLFRRTNRRINF
jgi:P27 family predicted phage terminase small subunit